LSFVGSSVTGESTIAALIFRFYNPEEGQITIDNKNIADYQL